MTNYGRRIYERHLCKIILKLATVQVEVSFNDFSSLALHREDTQNEWGCQYDPGTPNPFQTGINPFPGRYFRIPSYNFNDESSS